VNLGKPWGSLGCGEEQKESEFFVGNRIGDEKSSMKGFTSFLEVLGSCSAIDEGKVLLDAVDSWEKPIGPD
jgi:hypothetical protein